MPGPPFRTAVLEHENVVGRHVEVVALDLACHVVVVLEGDHLAAVLEQPLFGRRRLHNAAARRQISGEHGGRALARHRIAERVDHVALVDLGAGDVVANAFSGHGQARQIERALQLAHQRAQAAGVEEILHQEFSGRPHIGEHRNLARDLVETLHVELEAGAARHRHHVNDGIGRAAHRHVDTDGIVEGRRRQDFLRRQVFPDHLDNAAAGGGAHARMCRVGRGNRGSARQRKPQSLGDRHHRCRRAHHHAGAEGTCDAALELGPVGLADAACALLVPVFPGIGSRAELLAAPVAAQLGTGRHIDRGQAHADRAHDQRRRGLVAAAHQHGAVDRVAAQQLFRLHREEIAVEHRRGLHEGLRQRHRRKLDRKAAGLQHAALHVLGAVAQVRVAEVDVAPGIDDADHRLAAKIGGIEAALAQARAMPEGAQVVDAEPAMAAQVFGTFTCVHSTAISGLEFGARAPALALATTTAAMAAPTTIGHRHADQSATARRPPERRFASAPSE